jgi:hypothetical protein
MLTKDKDNAVKAVNQGAIYFTVNKNNVDRDDTFVTRAKMDRYPD